jgi:hypothetical protein
VAKRTAEERFWSKVQKTETCWIWTAACNGPGYGNFFYRGRTVLAHRIAYEWLVGAIPAELPLDHLCRMPACVNPAHLEPVTQKINILRGVAPSARNAVKTHCDNGHEFTPENTHIDKRGRNCRACIRDRKRQARGYQGLIYGGTHCRNGHEYTPQNTRTGKSGTRVCRTCCREAMRRYRAKQRAAGLRSH